MDNFQIMSLFHETAFVHTSGTEAELRVARLLADRCQALGVTARLEPFPVPMAQMESATLTVDGRDVPCTGYLCCGSGETEAELLYLPNTDPASLAQVRGRIALLDTGVSHFLFQDLVDNGAAGFITWNGNVHYPDEDIDQKELRAYVSIGRRLPGVNIHAREAFRLVKSGARRARIAVKQREYEGTSHNVVAEIPGRRDEWIALTAHYDTTPLSQGAYDNMSGCAALLEIVEALQEGAPHAFGLRFIFCGSEERGLLGSKAWVAAHEGELKRVALNVNIDMVGSVMGRFIACASADEGLVTYIKYRAAEAGFGIAARQGVYSSDSTPFADKGVPAVSFARDAGSAQSAIHTRYDTLELLSPDRLRADARFIADFTRRMADAPFCPVRREIPEKVRRQLDEYLNRRRKDN